MAPKFFFVVCASLALVNTIASCPCGAPAVAPACSARPAVTIGGCGLGGAYNAIGGLELVGGYNAIGGCGLGGGYNAVAVDNGGALGVISASALAPTGISILSTNDINGWVDVVGNAPFLAAVALEGNLPTTGSAGTAYSCGNGNVGMSAESLAAAGLAAGVGAYGPGIGLGAANYGVANLGAAALAGAEIAAINAGFGAGRLNGLGCGCGNTYY